MHKKTAKYVMVRSRFLAVILILVVLSFSAGCVRNVRPPLSVCVQRIDWTDKALDNLNDKNKIACLVLSDYCELHTQDNL
nr:MAG TPA: hypothetical protein [Bacteriophage sp.]